jgi:integrase
MKRLIAYAKEKSPNEFGILFEIAYFTGCRSGELYALEWSDFKKNEKGEYFFDIKKSFNWYEKRNKAPKNNEMRRVGLSNKFAATINELKLKKLDEKYIVPRIKDWEHGQASKRLREYLQELAIIPSDEVIEKELLEGAKNPKHTIRFHDLRGVSISHSLTNKQDLNAIMERVGHKTMSTTSLYLKKIEDHQNIAVANNLDFSDEADESAKVVELKKSRS